LTYIVSQATGSLHTKQKSAGYRVSIQAAQGVTLGESEILDCGEFTI
jgi:hypothetical protein